MMLLMAHNLFHTVAYRAARVATSAVNGNFLNQQKEQ